MIARLGLDIEFGQNARPALFTLIGVIMYSLMPLALATTAGDSPFLFLMMWRVGLGAGIGAFLVWRYSDLLFDKSVWSRALSPGRRWMFGCMMIGYTDIVLFSIAAGTVNISVATVLYELNPLFVVLCLFFLFRKERRYGGVTMMMALSFWLALIGVALVVMAQEGGLGNIGALGGDDFGNTMLGVAVGLGAAMIAAFSVYGFKWGTEFATELGAGRRSRQDMEFFGLMLSVFICNALSIPMLAGAVMITGESLDLSVIGGGFAWGFIGHALSTLARYYSLLRTTNLGINVIRYLLPVFALGWIFAWDGLGLGGRALLGEVDSLTLLLGVAVILAANLGIFIDDAQRERDEGFKPVNIADLIRGGETEAVEFKSHVWESRRESKRGGRFNYYMRDAVVRSVCGFLNAGGGVVIIGVADDGRALGFGDENKISQDRHTVYLTSVIRSKLGASAARRIRIEYARYQGKRICLVRVARGQEPVYLEEDKAERFYLRQGPEVASLSMSEANAYIKDRF